MASPHNKNSSSQAEIKKAWYHGFHKLEHGIYAGIKSFYIAKVVNYDQKNIVRMSYHWLTGQMGLNQRSILIFQL